MRRVRPGDAKSPFNAAHREKAGLTRDLHENLKAEMRGELYGGSKESRDSVALEYEGASRSYIRCVDTLLQYKCLA